MNYIKYDIIIIGAGPAGLFAATNLDDNVKTLILEKNNSAGKKLLLSGSGKCNITHYGDLKDFLTKYGDNSNFIKHALYTFSNQDLIKYFKNNDVDLFIDINNKVFPISEKSSDILNVLLKTCKDKDVDILYNFEVKKTKKIENQFHIKIGNVKYESDYLIIATGGKSYPSSGSTGDGYTFAKSFGHTIIEPRPALVPLKIKDYKYSMLAGMTLKQRTIYLYRQNKKIKTYSGDILLTHFGLSGPGILDFSRYIKTEDILKINVVNSKPDILKNEFIDQASKDGSISLKKFFKNYNVPENLIEEILLEITISANTKLSKVDKESRNKIIELFCNLPFEVEFIGDFNTAMVTAGGVNLKEISNKSMESRIIPNLYFVGEVLNIDGDTGGFNLQSAFSTSYVAAQHINMTVKKISDS
jgi:predicted Rossmann fold flavoprotein